MSISNSRSDVRPSPRLRSARMFAGLALLVAVAAPAVAGELYQWKDANGVTHYSDSPPPGKATRRTIPFQPPSSVVRLGLFAIMSSRASIATSSTPAA